MMDLSKFTLSGQTQKLLIGAVLYGAWAYMVYLGKADVQDFLETTKLGLYGVGLYHVAKVGSDNTQPPAPPAK